MRLVLSLGATPDSILNLPTEVDSFDMSLTNVTLLDTSSSSLDVPEPPLEGTVGPSGGTRSRGPPAPVPELPPRTRRARVSVMDHACAVHLVEGLSKITIA